MSDYVVIIDSTTDITEEMANSLHLTVIPLSFIVEGKTYVNTLDGKSISAKQFYEKVRQGITSTTAQINTEEFVSYFEPVLESGKDILYIAFSSGLSGTCQSAFIAKKQLQEKYPERRIEVFDSLSASMGEGLLVYHAANRWLAGESMDNVLKWLKDNVLKLAHWFTVDDLNHLKRGGRVSTASAMVGTVLGIKPVLHIDNEGHLIPVLKVRGRKQSLDALVKKIGETGTDLKNQVVFLSHGDSLDDANYVASEIRKKFNVKDIVINFIGPVIGAHAGAGTIALFFLATER